MLILLLSQCDHAKSVDQLEKYETEMSVKVGAISPEGLALAELAGQATVPMIEKSVIQANIDHTAQSYVGRYHVSISCQDPMVSCQSGTADFILNLLPDGTAHRTIIHFGTITFESIKQYRQDAWSYQPELQQITLHRANGVEFFYNIKESDRTIMNLNKIRNFSKRNRDFFSQGGAFPLHAYELKRIN